MRDTAPLLDKIRFPAICRGKLETLQVNVGYRCNQSCFHCHVNAGPTRTEEMTSEIADRVMEGVAEAACGSPRPSLCSGLAIRSAGPARSAFAMADGTVMATRNPVVSVPVG